MEIYQAMILGVLQGLTEFLPVSSSGHLVLGQICFQISEPMLAFDVSVHLGTLAAVFVVYYPDIRDIVKSLVAAMARVASGRPFSMGEDPHLVLAAMILAGSVPTAFLGFFLKRFEAFLFTSGVLVGCMLLTTGCILWLSRKFYRDDANSEKITLRKALLIGLSQGLAVVPGISRSGTTIACGMFAGLNRETAARFSFLLSIPAILGAELVSVKDTLEQGAHLLNAAIVTGTVLSFLSGLVALKLLLRLVHKGKFHYFAPYCWLAGTVVLVSYLL